MLNLFRRNQKLWTILTVLFFFVGFTAILAHHHEDSAPSHQCSVCHFIQQIVFAFILVVSLFIVPAAKAFLRLFFEKTHFLVRLFSASLQNRAPPVIS